MKKDGGYAFPADVLIQEGCTTRAGFQGGMSLRAYFAAAALQGILSSDRTYDGYEHVAEWACAAADALIAELEQNWSGNER